MIKERPDDESLDLSQEGERSRVVTEVLLEQETKDLARRLRTPRPTTTWNRVVAMTVLVVASLYVWIASPAWLEPAPPEPVPLEREEASLQLAVYLQAARVRAFHRERGRLPDILVETGEPLPGIRYDRVDARTFRLRALGDRATVLYLSSDSLPPFPRDFDRILTGRGP